MAWYKANYPIAFYTSYFIDCYVKEKFTPDVFDYSIEQIKEELVMRNSRQEDLELNPDTYILLVLYEYLLRGFKPATLISSAQKAGYQF